MNRSSILTAGMLLALAGGLCGCGEGRDESAPYNYAIGSGFEGLPTTADVDPTFLKDPADYTPAKFDPITPGGAVAASEGSESLDQKAVRGVAEQSLDAVLGGEVDALLDLFPDEKVAAIRDSDLPDSLDELITGLRDLWTTVEEKTADGDLAGLAQVPDALSLLAKFQLASSRVELIDDSTAVLVPDADRLAAQAEAYRPQIVPVLDKLLGAAPPQVLAMIPGGKEAASGDTLFDSLVQQMNAAAEMGADAPAGGPFDERYVKVGDEWKLDLPVTVTEQQAEALNGAVLVLNDFVDQVNDQIAAVDKLDQATLLPLVSQLQVSGLATFGRLQAELTPAFGNLFAQAAAGGAGQDTGPASGAGGGTISFSEEVLPILADRCAYCHEPGGRAYKSGIALDLSDEKAYVSLLDGHSGEDDGLSFVVPGDPDASYLLEKISQDTPAHGKRMPLKDDPLSDDEIELIRQWIAAGAKNDGEAPDEAATPEETPNGNRRVQPGGGG